MQDNDYRFTVNFYGDGANISNLSFLFQKFGIPSTIVEVGCYEGWTTFWLSDQLTQYNENLKIYAIDPHDHSDDLSDTINVAKENFLHNLESHPNKNVTHIPEYSNKALIGLINSGVTAELIYIDGDHFASSVLTDLVLAWELLPVGGVILCDDSTEWKFKDKNGTASAQMSPRMAIEMFIQCNWHKVQPIVLPNGLQTAFMKVAK